MTPFNRTEIMKVSQLKGTFSATATIQGDFVTENTESIADNITGQLEAQGAEVVRKATTIEVKGTGQTFQLPLVDKVRKGSVTFRSKDFIFSYTDAKGQPCNSYCNKPKSADMSETGFNTVDFRGTKCVWVLS